MILIKMPTKYIPNEVKKKDKADLKIKITAKDLSPGIK
jgi:hypothetical protein